MLMLISASEGDISLRITRSIFAQVITLWSPETPRGRLAGAGLTRRSLNATVQDNSQLIADLTLEVVHEGLGGSHNVAPLIIPVFVLDFFRRPTEPIPVLSVIRWLFEGLAACDHQPVNRKVKKTDKQAAVVSFEIENLCMH